MFWRSPLCDFILILTVFSIAKTYVFEKSLSNYEERYIRHSNRWARYIAVLIIVIGTFYAVGCDIGIANEEYYIYSLTLVCFIIYISALWFIHIDYQYGPKDYSFVKNVKLRVYAAIALPCLFLLIYFM